MKITISPELEAIFGVAAVVIGSGYVLFGFGASGILIAVGVMLLVRVSWIEYGLFGR